MFFFKKVSRDGVGHRENCALAHRVRKAVVEAAGRGDRRHVQDDSAARFNHRSDAGTRAVVHALHVDLEDAIEVGCGRGIDTADTRDARVVDEDVDALTASRSPKTRSTSA